jgi:hypothetical protein
MASMIEILLSGEKESICESRSRARGLALGIFSIHLIGCFLGSLLR